MFQKRSMKRLHTHEVGRILPQYILNAVLVCSVCICLFLILVQGIQRFTWKDAYVSVSSDSSSASLVTLFPVGVDPIHETITENPLVDTFVETHIGTASGRHTISSKWFKKLSHALTLQGWYQNLASVSNRVLVIDSGERKEQIAEHFQKILSWSDEERDSFLAHVLEAYPRIPEGVFFPGTYVVTRDATPELVAHMIIERFQNEVGIRYGSSVSEKVPLQMALNIASLIEREAYDFTDMRYISGVIWNRLFVDMKLQIDATLQYAKGSKPTEPWWPKVVPKDKYIASLYNTYEHEGLPPTAIANPSLEAILAALNPRETDCLYYFHDSNAGFHCTSSYKDHVALLKQYYGQGK
jgi:cell division protein YceG involved in septum cleavage